MSLEDALTKEIQSWKGFEYPLREEPEVIDKSYYYHDEKH